MPAGQIIGRVSVRVLPDTSNFRRDVKAQLASLEKGLKFVIATALDMTGAKSDLVDGIRKLDAEHRKVTIRAQLDFDKLSLDHVTATLDHWQRSHDPVKIKVEPNMMPGATALIAARMDVATRPRTLSVIPKLSSSGIAGFSAQVGTMLAALSGTRLLSSTFSNIWSMFQNLDKMIPLISAISVGVAGLAGLGLTAASNLFALSVSLAQIGVLGLALPGILTGIGIGLGITLIAMKGLKAALPDVYKQFQDMKTVITKDFWSGASAGIRNLATIFLPQLGTTAKAVGTFWGTLANALSKPFHTALAPMFDALNKSIQISTGSTGVFASIITQLGLTGASYLPRLATWFGNIATKFDNFLKRVRADGSMKAWTDAGLTALHDLGSVVSNLGGILAGISRAATAAGGSGLGVLADALERIHKVVDTPAFQSGLTDVLRSAHAAMTLIAEKSGPAVSKLFETLGKTLAAVLPMVGATLGTALAAIANALSQPALQTGLIVMFAGIQKGVDALAPVLPSLGVALGRLAVVIGTMAAAFGPVLAVALQSIVNIFLALAPAITALISPLSGMLLGAIKTLTPYLISFAGWLKDNNTWVLPVAIGVTALGVAFKALAAGAKAYKEINLVVDFAKMAVALPGHIASIVALGAKYVWMGVTATATGVKMAAAWVVGLGPVAWIVTGIAAVVGAIIWVATQTTWFQTIWEYTWHAIEKVIGGIVSNIVIGFKVLFDGIMWAVGGIVHAASLIPGPWQSGMQTADRAVQSFIGNADRNMQGIIDGARTWGDKTGTNFATGVAGTVPAVNAAATAVAAAAKAPLVTIPAHDAGVSAGANFAGGLNVQLPSVSASAFAAASAVKAPLATVAPAAYITGMQTNTQFGSGLMGNQGPVSAAAVATASAVTAPLGTIKTVAAFEAAQSAAAIAGGLTNPAALSAINAAGVSVADAIKVGVTDQKTLNPVQIGYNVAMGLAKGLRDGSSDVTKAAQGTAQAVNHAMRIAWDMQSPSKVTETMGLNLGAGLVNGINTSKPSVSGSATSLASGVTTAFSTGFTTAKNTATGILDSLVTWTGGVPGRTVSALTPLNTVANWFSTWFTSAKTTATGVLDSTVTWITGVPGRTVSALTPLNTVSNWFSTWFTAAKNTATGVLDSTVTWITGVPGRTVSALTPLNTVSSWFSTWFTSAKTTATNVLNSTVTWITGVPGRAVTALTPLSTLSSWFSKWFGGAKTGATTVLNSLMTWVGTVPGSIVAKLPGLGTLLTQKGKDTIQGLKNGMATVWTQVASWISTIAGWIKANKGPVSLDAQLLVPAGKAIMQGFWDGLKSKYSYITDWIKGVAAGVAGGIGGGIAGGVARWLPLVNQALTMLGLPLSLAPTVLRRMNQESGGNPNAINLTDSNAKLGIPSQGLMQCIPPTFMHWRLPQLSANIMDPLSNIVASMRYTVATYGSLPAGYNKAGGYAFGTNNAAAGWAWVGEHGPELLKFRGGETVVPNHALSTLPSGAGGTTINIPMMPTNSTPEDVADALLFAVRRMANGGVYASAA